MRNVTSGSLIPVSRIEIPQAYRRKGDAVEDDILRKSIEQGGIQVPLVVSKLTGLTDERFVLIDGFRRLEIARDLKMKEVPCVLDDIPKGAGPEEYRNRLRFILDEHRQDLFPSQRASLINNLKERFQMNNKEVGAYLGVDGSTIGNWLLVDKLIPEVVEKIDAQKVSIHSCRAFEGMTEEGQRRVWEEQKDNFVDKKNWSAEKLHKHVRATYSPDKMPELYENPRLVSQKLSNPVKKRRAKKRHVIERSGKRPLLTDIDLLEVELKENEKELAKLKAEIEFASPVIEAILLHDELLALLSDSTKRELEEFAEVRL